jgi:hypothetical protein
LKPGAILGGLAGIALLAAGIFQIVNSGSKPVTAADIEARVMEESINGPYLTAFKEALPEDYAAIMPPILAQQAENLDDPGLFDRMFLERMQVFQKENLAHLASADAAALAEFADRQAAMIDLPRLCEAVMADPPKMIDGKDTEARKISVERDIALFKGIAAGRAKPVVHGEPTAEQDAALSARMAPYLTPEVEAAILNGSFAGAPPKQRCPVLAAYWKAIADLPTDESAVWAAFLVRQGG